MFYRFIDADTIHIYIFCAWLGGEFVDSSSIAVRFIALNPSFFIAVSRDVPSLFLSIILGLMDIF